MACSGLLKEANYYTWSGLPQMQSVSVWWLGTAKVRDQITMDGRPKCWRSCDSHRAQSLSQKESGDFAGLHKSSSTQGYIALTELFSPQAFIHVIDINQHRPQFLESHYEVRIPEDTPSGREILQVSATDKDKGKGLIYTIHGSMDPKSTRFFQLDPSSGALTTAEGFSSQPMPQHTLTVMVSPIQTLTNLPAAPGHIGC